MANNRIYIRCKKCGECLFLGKHFNAEYYWQNYSKEEVHLEDKLNDFFEKHCWCEEEFDESQNYCNTPVGKFTTWDTKYEIAYEFDSTTKCKNCHRSIEDEKDCKVLEEYLNELDKRKHENFRKVFTVSTKMKYDEYGNLIAFQFIDDNKE